MFVKLGDAFIISLIVENSSGARISDDTPLVTFYDTKAKQYWNGISWQTNKFVIYMEYQDNGVYSASFTPDRVGSFVASAKSETYGATQTMKIDVFDESIAKYNWQAGLSFTASHVRTNALPITNPPKVTVNRVFDNTFLNTAGQWENTPAELSMTHIGSNVFTCSFIPSVESDYILTIVDDTYEGMFAITASIAGSDVLPVLIGSNSVLSNNGTDSVVVSEKGIPLPGVSVKIFNPVTKELTGTATTNDSGEWSLLVKPGRYIFMFEKDGYSSAGFERTVT